MDHLSPAEVGELRIRLREERARLVAQAGADSTSGTEPVEVGDAQDRAVEESIRADEVASLERAALRIEAIDRALARMDAGTYGICEDSGDPIPFARLAIDPAVRCTVDAQEAREDPADSSDLPDEAY